VTNNRKDFIQDIILLLEAEKGISSTRVIVLTAKDDPSVRRTAMKSGASAFFLKGVEGSEFLAGVKDAVDSDK
jgi:DNA-binding NarL/FixJ family response regulator